MADTKITALTAITTVDPAVDVLPIVDVSDTTMAASGTTKKITSNQILGAGGTATLASATITGDLTVDTNTLFVNSTSNAVCVGTLTSQNVSAGRGNLTIGGTSSAILNLSINGGDTGYIIHDGTNITFNNRTNGYVEFFANGLAQHRIAPLGVFSWYDGAGGTRMTLNSTGLGVGVTPGYPLHVQRATAGPTAWLANSTTYSQLKMVSSGTNQSVYVTLNPTGTGAAIFQISDVDRLTIDTSGNVGVGVTPSANRFQVAGNIGLPNSCTASGETSGVFSIDVANLLALTGANWRQCSFLLVYSGVDTNLGNSTVLQTVVTLQGLSTYGTISKNDIVGTASVAVSNDTASGARITVTVPTGNAGSVYVMLLGGAGSTTRPSITINA